MNDDDIVHDSRAPLKHCEFGFKYLGVLVYDAGTSPAGERLADVTCYRPTLDQVGSGGTRLLADADAEIDRGLQFVIAEIDAAIMELSAHKQRLFNIREERRRCKNES